MLSLNIQLRIALKFIRSASNAIAMHFLEEIESAVFAASSMVRIFVKPDSSEAYLIKYGKQLSSVNIMDIF